MNQDALGDQIDFDLLDNALLSIVKKGDEGAAVKKTEQYAYYENMKKFACAICVSTIEGDEAKAIEHVKQCASLPKDAATGGKTFCATCWRSFSTDSIAKHFNSVGHNQIIDRMTANGETNISVWLMKNGPTFVRPGKAGQDVLYYGVMTGVGALEMPTNCTLRLALSVLESKLRTPFELPAVTLAPLVPNSAQAVRLLWRSLNYSNMLLLDQCLALHIASEANIRLMKYSKL